MKYEHVQAWFIAIISLVFWGLGVASQPAWASEPAGDYWFSETIAVSQVELPPGVVISAPSTPDEPRATLVLENRSEHLLFVLSLNYKDVLLMETPDPRWEARVNMAHEVASYTVAAEKPASLDMGALSDLDKRLVDRNVFSPNPPPEDVIIPEPQSSELLLVYGEQVLLVPFSISYSLNPVFSNALEVCGDCQPGAEVLQNTATAPAQLAAADASHAPRMDRVWIVLLGGLILLLAGGLAWFRHLRHR